MAVGVGVAVAVGVTETVTFGVVVALGVGVTVVFSVSEDVSASCVVLSVSVDVFNEVLFVSVGAVVASTEEVLDALEDEPSVEDAVFAAITGEADRIIAAARTADSDFFKVPFTIFISS